MEPPLFTLLEIVFPPEALGVNHRELRRTQAVQPTTKIEGFVLGASIEPGLEEMKTGETVVKPFQYDLLLNRAHSRIFNLAKRIRESSPKVESDVEVEDVLSQQLDFDVPDAFGNVAMEHEVPPPAQQ